MSKSKKKNSINSIMRDPVSEYRDTIEEEIAVELFKYAMK